MVELIRKKEAIEKIWQTFNGCCNDASKFEQNETKAMNRAFSILQNDIEDMPTVTEAEIRAKAIDEFVTECRKTSLNSEYVSLGMLQIEKIAEQLKGE